MQRINFLNKNRRDSLDLNKYHDAKKMELKDINL